MSRYKMSNYSEFQIFQTVFNEDERSLDVSLANSLTPSRYDSIQYEYITAPHGKEVEYATFYGNGSQQVSEIRVREYPLGNVQLMSLFLGNKIPSQLIGKFLVIADATDTIGIWFNVDSSPKPTDMVANREISITLSNIDTTESMTQRITDQINLDPFLSAMKYQSAVYITNVEKFKWYEIDTNMDGVSIVEPGYPSLNSTYILLRNDYYIWFNEDGQGIDPTFVGLTGIEIQYNTSDRSLVARKIADELNTTFEFSATSELEYVNITNINTGYVPVIESGDSGCHVEVISNGVDPYLIGRVRIYYDVDWDVIEVKRIL